MTTKYTDEDRAKFRKKLDRWYNWYSSLTPEQRDQHYSQMGRFGQAYHYNKSVMSLPGVRAQIRSNNDQNDTR